MSRLRHMISGPEGISLLVYRAQDAARTLGTQWPNQYVNGPMRLQRPGSVAI